MVVHVKRTVLWMILFTVALADASGQESDWSGYLSGEERRVVRQAISTVDAALPALSAALERQYDLYISRHITARRDGLGPSGYRELLEPETVRPGASPEEIRGVVRDSLSAIHDQLRRSAPVAGTSGYWTAEAWLRDVDDELRVPVEPVMDLLQRIQQVGQGAPEASLASFEDALGLPLPDSAVSAAGQDRLFYLAGHWRLLYLSAPGDEERLVLLSQLSAAARSLSFEARDQVDRWSETLRRESAFMEETATRSREALPVLTAAAFAEPGELSPGDRDILESLIDGMAQAGREELVRAAGRTAAVRFAVDVSERLLLALTDRRLHELAITLGMTRAELQATAFRLYRVRLDLYGREFDRARSAAETSMERYRQTGNFADERDMLRMFRNEGTAHVTGLEPWVSGERSRTGDSYRWALLSVLSNRYAQHLILTNPDYADAQRLVGGFVAGLYDGAIARLAPGVSRVLRRATEAEAADAFDRVYVLPLPEAALTRQESTEPQATDAAAVAAAAVEPLYLAFAVEAQGDQVSELFTSASPSGITIAAEWAHDHGLHVAVVPSEAPGELLENTVLSWFDLAAAADNDMQSFSDELRGVLALITLLEQRISPELQSAGSPALRLYSPRLAAVARSVERVPRFEQTPGETLAALFAVYPEAEDLRALVRAVGRSITRVADRLADVDSADRRAIQFQTGVTGP